jgi:hypothetical protein
MPLLETIGSGAARGLGLFANVPYPQALPTAVSNLHTWYTADTYVTGSSGFFPDQSGNGRNSQTAVNGANIGKGTLYSASAQASKSFTTVYSTNTNAYIDLNTSIKVHQDDYTLFHVTRRTGDAPAGRIFNGTPTNWLSGFHDVRSGVAYHANWIADGDNVASSGERWIISRDQLNQYYWNSVINAPSPAVLAGVIDPSTYIGINNYIGQQGSWAVAEVIYYNRKLSNSECFLIEGYLANKYGITLVGQ